ncbi:hypothetical protein QFZ56_005748 [Streptomyces achromogenes]|uniref:Uncharacterized protein n=1 Tax=Streptomyces achromogenes TaxID=67255 RepID=A0ABU0Q7Z6_STRAH|nr:hypothetical protein [Streptomyces achromogenes]
MTRCPVRAAGPDRASGVVAVAAELNWTGSDTMKPRTALGDLTLAIASGILNVNGKSGIIASPGNSSVAPFRGSARNTGHTVDRYPHGAPS